MATPSEIVFEVAEDEDGRLNARALGYSIFTFGDDWEDLKRMVKDATLCHFDDGRAPKIVRLRMAREEVMAV